MIDVNNLKESVYEEDNLFDAYRCDNDVLDWKDEGEFKTFLLELERYLVENKRIDSEEFIYEGDEIPFTAKNNCFKYVESLCCAVFKYCDEYSLPCINEEIEDNLCFNEYCLLLKYKNFYYKIERISGQGSLDIISLYEGDNKNYYIDYECIVNGHSLLNHKELIKNALDNALEGFKKDFQKQLALLNCDVIFIEK